MKIGIMRHMPLVYMPKVVMAALIGSVTSNIWPLMSFHGLLTPLQLQL